METTATYPPWTGLLPKVLALRLAGTLLKGFCVLHGRRLEALLRDAEAAGRGVARSGEVYGQAWHGKK